MGEGGEPRMRLGQTGPEIEGLEQYQRKRDQRGGNERVRRDNLNRAQARAEHRAKGEGDTETGPDEGHGRAAARFIRDIRDNGIGQLHIRLAEATDHATGQESAEVRRGDPERDAADVPEHSCQQGAATTMAIG